MVMAVWPQLLPQEFAAQGCSDTLANNVITDDYKAGPPNYRRRTTSGPENFNGQMFMTALEWQTLSTFFHTTLFDGVMRFLLPPQGTTDQTTYWICRFVTPPLRQMLHSDDLWAVSLSLEKLGYGQGFASAPFIVDPDIFYQPSVANEFNLLSPALYSDADIFYAPSVTAQVTAHIIISFAEVEAES